MRRTRTWARIVASLALISTPGCTSAGEPADASRPPDASHDAHLSETDAAHADVGLDAPSDAMRTDVARPDAGPCGAPPTRIAYAAPVLGAAAYLGSLTRRPYDGAILVGGDTRQGSIDHDAGGFHGVWSETSLALEHVVRYVGSSTVAGMTFASDGSLFMAGSFSAPATIEGTTLDGPPLSGTGFVVRTLGTTTSVLTYAATEQGNLGPIVPRPAGGVLVGGWGWVGQDIVLALDADGTLEWMHTVPSDDAYSMMGVATDEAGNAYVTGSTSSLAIDGGAALAAVRGPRDGFVVSFDPSGVLRWARVVGTTSARDGLVRVAVAGSYVVAVGAVDADDAGVTPADAPLGDLDGAVVMLDRDTGADVWLGRVGGAGVDALVDLAIDACDGVWVVGSHARHSAADGIMAHVDRVARRVDATIDVSAVEPLTLLVDADGSVFVGGDYVGTPLVGPSTLPDPFIPPYTHARGAFVLRVD